MNHALVPENIDQTTLERIKKALNLSKHPGTTENEARQAMRYVSVSALLYLY